MEDEYYCDDTDYCGEQAEIDEKYGDECVVCGQKLRNHDNDICNKSCE